MQTLCHRRKTGDFTLRTAPDNRTPALSHYKIMACETKKRWWNLVQLNVQVIKLQQATVSRNQILQLYAGTKKKAAVKAAFKDIDLRFLTSPS